MKTADIIALILYAVLWPCISYIIIYRSTKKIIPWNGGIMLFMADNTYVPLDLEEKNMLDYPNRVDKEIGVQGLFFPGANVFNMPQVKVTRVNEPIIYSTFKEELGGVYIVLNETIKGDVSPGNRFNCIMIELYYAYSFKRIHKQNRPEDENDYCGKIYVTLW